jgi:hypothetical protein
MLHRRGNILLAAVALAIGAFAYTTTQGAARGVGGHRRGNHGPVGGYHAGYGFALERHGFGWRRFGWGYPYNAALGAGYGEGDNCSRRQWILTGYDWRLECVY